VRRRWTYPRKGRRDPRALDGQIVELVVQMAEENPSWGYLRIVGECRKLDITVSATSVRHLAHPPARPGVAPRRAELDRVPARSGAGTIACDFLTVETVGLMAASLSRSKQTPPKNSCSG
jgi:hypothetical protein